MMHRPEYYEKADHDYSRVVSDALDNLEAGKTLTKRQKQVIKNMNKGSCKSEK